MVCATDCGVIVDREFAELIPPLTEQERMGLEEALLREGCIDPLIVWVEEGILLDGHNRKAICDRYDIDYTTRELCFDSRDEAKRWVIEHQFGRRNLTAYQRAELALQLKPILAAEAATRIGGRPQKDAEKPVPKSGRVSKTDASLAKKAGVGKDTIHKADYIHQHADEATKQKLRRGHSKISIHSVYQGLRKAEAKQRREERKAAAVEVPNDEAVRLFHSDIADATSHVDADSVDFIITDPPYPEKYLPTFSHLADFAAHALKPGGSLICMSGQSYLPEVFARLSASELLRYHWTLAYLTPGGKATQLWKRKVNTFWKPLLWFVKGDYAGDWVGDVSRSAVNDNDKDHHHWGQSVSGMKDLLDRFVLPGQVICDPFLGGGATAIAAQLCNCRFIGLDIDEDCLSTTRRRLASMSKETN